MDLESYIHEAIFEENEKHTQLYEMIWSNFEEDGFVITDEPDNEIDCIFKAVAIQNLIGEFIYRVYDEVNETGYEDIIQYLGNLGISEESAVAYCENNENIDTDDDDNELKLKNGLDYITEVVADKMLELFSATDLFDYFFAATYDFEQDFTFAFEDVDEFMAFVDSNTERLDEYKDEYPSVLSWIESGMIV
ncbi:MAG: hypothetical protein ACI4IN_05410 [Eubacterium sp.]